MKIRSASVDELWLGAQLEHQDGRLRTWRYRVARAVHLAALWLLRAALGSAPKRRSSQMALVSCARGGKKTA